MKTLKGRIYYDDHRTRTQVLYTGLYRWQIARLMRMLRATLIRPPAISWEEVKRRVEEMKKDKPDSLDG